MSIAQNNRISQMEQKIAALEAAFSRLSYRPADGQAMAILEDKVVNLSNQIMAMKARMGKIKSD